MRPYHPTSYLPLSKASHWSKLPVKGWRTPALAELISTWLFVLAPLALNPSWPTEVETRNKRQDQLRRHLIARGRFLVGLNNANPDSECLWNENSRELLNGEAIICPQIVRSNLALVMTDKATGKASNQPQQKPGNLDEASIAQHTSR